MDFVFVRDGKPQQFIEVKTSAKEVSPHLQYLKRKFPEVHSYQLHLDAKTDYVSSDGIRVCPAWVYLAELKG